MVVSRLLMSRHPKTASKAHPGDVPTLHTLRSHVDEVSVWSLCNCPCSNAWSPVPPHYLLVQLSGAGQWWGSGITAEPSSVPGCVPRSLHPWLSWQPWHHSLHCWLLCIGWCESNSALKLGRKDEAAEQGFDRGWAWNEQKWSILKSESYWCDFLVDFFWDSF